MSAAHANRTRTIAAALAALVATVVPAATQERVLPVPVATIYPGDTIRESGITLRSFPSDLRTRLPVIDLRAAVVGKVARRTLYPGEPIPTSAVDEPRIVTRGTPTEIIFEENGLRITAIGSPLENGGLNDIIQLRNTDTGRIVIGRVQADGKVRIGMP